MNPVHEPPTQFHSLPDGSLDEGLAAPSRWALLGEGRVVAEWVVGWIAARRVVRATSPAAGEPVVVVPGLLTGDPWTARLRRVLRRIGYRAVGWGMGRNHGEVLPILPELTSRVERMADEQGAPVRLVGWSLGGILCREVARDRPDCVERVVTLGTPVVGGPFYTQAASLYRRRGYDLESIEALIAEREATPLQVPVLAVYSGRDNVVAWRACVDRFSNPRVEHVEVSTTHFGLLVAPESLRLVVDLLARPRASIAARPGAEAGADGDR